jgi:undecaprenyl-diphosphatase
MLDYVLEFDRELLLYLNNLGHESWDGFWFTVTNKCSSIPLYVLLLFLMAKGLGKKGVGLLVVCLAAMITFTDQVTNLFKDGFERLRPCAQEGVVEFLRLGDCHGFGFFSGHSSNSMAAAVFTILMLKSKYKKFIFLMIPWSLMVGYSRIYIGKHYPLDVVCGLAFGAISGYLFYILFIKLKLRFINLR